MMSATITTAGNASRGRRSVPWWRSWPAMIGAGVVVLALGAWGFTGSSGSDGGAEDGPIFVAERGPMTISVTESGTIQAREQVVLKNEVEGQTTIIWIIEEGKHVKEGDLLVELDASQLQDNRVDQEIRVQNADAAYIRARESLEITKSKGDSDVAQAELDYTFAQQDLKKYVEGEYPKQLNELEARIKLAEGDLEDAENTAQWSQRLFDEKYIAQTDLTRDELQLERAKLDLKNAQADRELLVNYTHDRQIAELKSDVDQTKMALDRVKRQASANNVQDEADLNAKELELKRQKEKLAKIEDQIGKTKIYSPAAGMVIYATTGQDSRRGNDEPLEAGRTVREREDLILLPTANSMLVNIKVHESSLKKVQIDQRVRITINALPGKEYFGRVARISPLPDAQSFWRGNPDLKVYNSEIHLDGELEGVRTGMTCKAQVIVQQLNDVISVPVQSVVKIGSQPTVYIKRGRKVEPVAVELGLDNKDRVHIVSGLSEGDRVLTNPPLQDAGVMAPDSEQIAPDETQSNDASATQDGDHTSAPAPAPADTAAQTQQAPAPGGGEPPADGQRRQRPDTQNMTPEQREAMRQRMQNMTPEEREAMRQRRQEQRDSQPGANPGGQDAQK